MTAASLERHTTPDGKLTLFIARSPDEITIGFEGCEWHTHGDILYVYEGVGDSSPPETATGEFLAALTSNQLAIVVVEIEGELRDAWVLDSLSDIPTEEAGESIRTCLWDGSPSP